MILIHKLLKKHSLRTLSSQLLAVASACVFLVCKVRYMPISLSTAAHAHYQLQIRLQAQNQHHHHQSSSYGSGGGGGGMGYMGSSGGAHYPHGYRQPAFTAVVEGHYKELIEEQEHLVL